MAYEQAQKPITKSHGISMENRAKLSLSGVEDVSGFDESVVLLRTSLGMLSIRGEQLHIDRIDLDCGELELKGKIQELSYDETPPRASLWARLFG